MQNIKNTILFILFIINALVASIEHIPSFRYKQITLLYNACINNNMPIIEAFITDQHPHKDFFLSARYDQDRNTLLHLAIQHQKTNIALYLIKQQSPLNIYNKQGLTPLHCAADQNNVKIFSTLIHAGADHNTYGLDGLTPYGLALRKIKTDIVIFCQESPFNTDFELQNMRAYKSYLIDHDGYADFNGWRINQPERSDQDDPSEKTAIRQSYLFQLQKTGSLPSFPLPLNLNIDDHPLSFSTDK